MRDFPKGAPSGRRHSSGSQNRLAFSRRHVPHPTSADAEATFSRKREKGRALVCGIALVAVLTLATPLQAEDAKPGVDPSIGKVDVTLELPKDKPYVGEMILLRMRSFVRAFIVLDEIRQPPLTNFDWQQLGRDKPIQAMVDGFSVAGIERDIAIFPEQPGRLIIDPFVRHVTIATDDNGRAQADFVSKPIYVDIQSHAGIGDPNAWWLPTKSLTLTDSWSQPPDEIKPGTLARRVVTIEAVGLTADRLPPPPTMLAPGTIVFKGPANRETTITEDGPVARATYQWDIRPISTSPAQMPALHVPWYDTTERRMRDAAIPDLWVAYTGTLVHPSHEKAKTWTQTYLSIGPVAAGLAGFAWTAAVAGALLTRPPRRRAGRRGRILRDLRRAGRYHDASRVRAALTELALDDPARWAKMSKAPLVAGRLAALDAARYGRDGGTPPPLAPLADDVARLMEEADATAPAGPGLPALDGPLAAPRPKSRWARR